jgi:hypothetical protein
MKIVYFILIFISSTIVYQKSGLDAGTTNHLEPKVLNEDEDLGHNTDLLHVPRAKPGITIEAKPYRPIKKRPRDGKPCDCKQCFGVCQVKVKVTFDLKAGNFGMILPERGSSKAKLLFGKKYDHAESEFVLDEDIVLSDDQLRQLDLDKFQINKGIYRFSDKVSRLEYGGKKYTTYGMVEVNIDME